MSSLTYYVGATLDGFIAAPDGSADFLPVTADLFARLARDFPDTIPTHLRATFGLGSDAERFGAAVMGRATYQPARDAGVADPYAHLATYVVSTTLPPGTTDGVEVVADPVALVRRLKSEGTHVWLVGGGVLATALAGEIDEVVLKVYPCTAGDGVPLFAGRFRPRSWQPVGTEPLPGGVLLARYRPA
ncbi:MAG: dihydrofolate reductase family protein [Acidimicrobiia bacterium]